MRCLLWYCGYYVLQQLWGKQPTMTEQEHDNTPRIATLLRRSNTCEKQLEDMPPLQVHTPAPATHIVNKGLSGLTGKSPCVSGNRPPSALRCVRKWRCLFTKQLPKLHTVTYTPMFVLYVRSCDQQRDLATREGISTWQAQVK